MEDIFVTEQEARGEFDIDLEQKVESRRADSS